MIQFKRISSACRNGLRSLIGSHAVAIALALFVGFCSIAPHLIAVRLLGDANHGIPFLPLDNEDEYLARIQEVVDGYWRVSSPFYYEYKDLPSYIPPYYEYVYAVPALLFHIPAADVLLAAKAVLPALLFLLVYALVFRMLASLSPPLRRSTAAACGLWITLCYQLIPPLLLQQWLHGQPFLTGVSIWTRPVNPVIGALLLFLFLHLLWSLLTHARLRDAVLGGVLVGLMSSYFFSWAFGLTLIVMFAIAALASRSYPLLKRTGWMSLAALLASLPALVPMALQAFGGTSASAARNGLQHTHLPLLNKFVLIGIILFLALVAYANHESASDTPKRARWWSRILSEKAWLLCAVILAASFWVYVQNVVTGISIWPYHFVQYTKPLVAFVLFLSGALALGVARPRVWKGIVVLLSLVAILNGALTVFAFHGWEDVFRAQQRYGASLAWLNAHAEKDCVVLVREEGIELMGLVPALTHCNLYLSHSRFSGVSEERIQHDFFIRLRLDGVTTSTLHDYVYEHETFVRDGLFENWDELSNQGVDAWFEATVARVEAEYPEWLAEPLPALLGRYRLDYLLTEEDLTPETLRDWGVGRQIGNFDGLRLYEFVQ